MSEKRLPSKVEVVKEKFQAELAKHGIKVSKQVAWNLFKKAVELPFEIIGENYEEAGKPEITYGAKIDSLVLSIAGVGRYEALIAGTRDKQNEGVLLPNPKARFYPSSSIEERLRARLGFAKADAFVEVEAEEEVSSEELSPDLQPEISIDLDEI